MKYRVRVRRYKTVIEDGYFEVEASGKRIAEQRAIVLASSGLMEELFEPSRDDVHDVKYEVVRVAHADDDDGSATGNDNPSKTTS